MIFHPLGSSLATAADVPSSTAERTTENTKHSASPVATAQKPPVAVAASAAYSGTFGVVPLATGQTVAAESLP